MKVVYILIVAFCLLIGATVVIAPMVVKTDVVFVCDNTGSYMGYTVGRFGGKTSAWRIKSEIQTFMEAKHPEEFTARWKSHSEVGKNLFGKPVSTHAVFGPCFGSSRKVLDRYWTTASDEEKLQTYRSLAAANCDEGLAIVRSIRVKALASLTNFPFVTATNSLAR